MEELMRNLYLFLTEAERGDVLRIHGKRQIIKWIEIDLIMLDN